MLSLWSIYALALLGLTFAGITCCCGCTTCLACDAGDVAALGIDVTISGVTGTPVCAQGIGPGTAPDCASVLNATYHTTYVSGAGSTSCRWARVESPIGGSPSNACAFFTTPTATVDLKCVGGEQVIEGYISAGGSSVTWSGEGFFRWTGDTLGCTWGPISLPYQSTTYSSPHCVYSGATYSVETV